ncbi:MAG: hypothetical protein KQ78_01554 [Candidatus Izimaplasma bacterium HR2]|nr:MAG: hypothetical protein KQ78_01554 [Candidatus Izimaplasma bacterium HR2]
MKISTLFADDIFRSKIGVFSITKLSSHYPYHLQGKALNCLNAIIEIGDLLFSLDKPLPKDIKNNEFVEFNVERLDCTIE